MNNHNDERRRDRRDLRFIFCKTSYFSAFVLSADSLIVNKVKGFSKLEQKIYRDLINKNKWIKQNKQINFAQY